MAKQPPFEWTLDRQRQAITAYALGLSMPEVCKILGCALVTMERFRKRNPAFEEQLERAKAERKQHAFTHAFRTAFPSDENGNYVKGDTSMGIFLLKTQFGLREKSEAGEFAEALAPIIQFALKQPVDNAKTNPSSPGAYFDPQKETPEG